MDSGFHHYNRERCISCQKCATVCFSGALSAGGRAYTLPELLPVLTRDARLYALSGGGVTFSGGEPLLQSDAVAALCTCLRNEQVHCAVDTALNVPWPAVAQVAACADLFLVDLKLMDSEKHKQYTGYGNKLILDNLQKLSTLQSVIIRVPVVCGVNDDQENAVQTAQFLATKCKSVVQVELLPYHDLGIQKAAQMGIQQQRFATPSSAKMDELTAIYSAHGLSANHQ